MQNSDQLAQNQAVAEALQESEDANARYTEKIITVLKRHNVDIVRGCLESQASCHVVVSSPHQLPEAAAADVRERYLRTVG